MQLKNNITDDIPQLRMIPSETVTEDGIIKKHIMDIYYKIINKYYNLELDNKIIRYNNLQLDNEIIKYNDSYEEMIRKFNKWFDRVFNSLFKPISKSYIFSESSKDRQIREQQEKKFDELKQSITEEIASIWEEHKVYIDQIQTNIFIKNIMKKFNIMDTLPFVD